MSIQAKPQCLHCLYRPHRNAGSTIYFNRVIGDDKAYICADCLRAQHVAIGLTLEDASGPTITFGAAS